MKNNDILCNWCGMSCILGDASSFECASGLIKAEVQGGYLSTAGNGEGALDDCSSYKFSLCEFCLDHLFSKFNIPVEQTDYADNEPITWEPAHQRVLFSNWRRGKKEFFENKEKRDKSRKIP